MKYLLFIWMLPFIMIIDGCNTIQENKSISEESFDLEYLVREPKDATSQAPVLILLHGYGSNEKDLFSFADQIPNNWLVITVRAPFEISDNQFKWYDIKMVEKKITMNFEKAEKSRRLLLKFIDQIVLKYNANKSKIVTAGFSQGAIMSIGLLLTEPEKILAAGCFSGRFMEELRPLITNKKILKSKQIFLSHGTEDKVFPFQYAEENKEVLEGMGIKVKFSADNIAHSISPKQLTEFISWMKSL